MLLVSSSARWLAQSARRAGIGAVTLDHYADADTAAAATLAIALPDTGQGFDPDLLLDTCQRVAPPATCPLIYGSGLDSQPALLRRLARQREVIGNPPALQRIFRNPRRFFAVLDACAIPYPEVRFTPPENPTDWLIKSGCSEGGKRVRFCAHDSLSAGDYWQRRVEGPARSVLFLANGRQSRTIGFNTLWTLGMGQQPFLFAGALNRTDLDPAAQRQLERHVAELVQYTGLKGLNSLDFMVDDRGTPRVIEVNTRPSATMALYDADARDGLLAAHIEACRHGRLEVDLKPSPVRASRVWLAPALIAVAPDTPWPAWTADRPPAGSVVSPQHPFCSVLAEGQSVAEVTACIEHRNAALQHQFNRDRRDRSPTRLSH